MKSTMESPAMLENGKPPQNRKSTCLRGAFYALAFVLIIISALVSLVFCLNHHKQAPGPCWAHGSFKELSPQDRKDMTWDWKLEHCNGIVQDQGQYLIIEQSGNYFIYAQLFGQEKANARFTLMLYKDPEIVLNNAVGHDDGTVNFARPFFLEKGDKLYCRENHGLNNTLLKNQTYWGLFKM